MHILCTGGAGYIGSVLVGELLAVGHQVTVLDNFMYGQMPLNHLCQYPKLTVIRGDVRTALTRELIQSFDVLIPLAAIVGAPACDRNPSLALETNQTVYWMVRWAKPEQLIIYPNTNSGYGTGNLLGQPCTEETEPHPISAYASHKTSGERWVLVDRKIAVDDNHVTYSYTRPVNSISLRLATVFGMSPRMRLDLLVNDFVYRAVNDRFVVLFEPHFKRNYIHVRDVVSAIMFCIQNQHNMAGQAYNVGLSSANLSKLELCQVIQKHVPGFTFVEAPIGKDPDQRDYIVSNAKIEAAGWRPAWSLDDGIEELIKGYAMLKRREFSNA